MPGPLRKTLFKLNLKNWQKKVKFRCIYNQNVSGGNPLVSGRTSIGKTKY